MSPLEVAGLRMRVSGGGSCLWGMGEGSRCRYSETGRYGALFGAFLFLCGLSAATASFDSLSSALRPFHVEVEAAASARFSSANLLFSSLWLEPREL